MSSFVEQIKRSIPNVNVTNVTKSISNVFNDTKQGLTSAISDFKNKSILTASSEFLNSNSLLAKFAFIIFIVVTFMVLLKMSIGLVAFFLRPSQNPYVVRGALYGNDRLTITQDPSLSDSIIIPKSNDQNEGAEFTWSTWLFLNSTSDLKLRPVFVKGNQKFREGVDDNRNLNNGPGLYLQALDTQLSNGMSSEYNMYVIMDHIGGEKTSGENSGRDTIKVERIPINKWIHVAIRLQNKMLDIYVNGIIAKRHHMTNAPKQNFHEVMINPNGGFDGKLSDLRYFSYALNVFEINNIVLFGPTLTPSTASIDKKAATGTYSYLSNLWYTKNY